jgi:Leucine-rich repeat (LRR) protein
MGISRLVSLAVLDMSENQIRTVPDELCTMTSLREINLSHNAIESLPLRFGLLYGLTVLCMHANPLMEPLVSHCRDGPAALLNYMIDQLPGCFIQF